MLAASSALLVNLVIRVFLHADLCFHHVFVAIQNSTSALLSRTCWCCSRGCGCGLWVLLLWWRVEPPVALRRLPRACFFLNPSPDTPTRDVWKNSGNPGQLLEYHEFCKASTTTCCQSRHTSSWPSERTAAFGKTRPLPKSSYRESLMWRMGKSNPLRSQA